MTDSVLMRIKVSPNIVFTDMLDLGEALEDEKLMKIKNSNIWISIEQNFVYSVSSIPALTILVITTQSLTYLY